MSFTQPRESSQLSAVTTPDQARPRVLITLATYNEVANVPRLVDAIFAIVPHADVLVIDDNSPDGTGSWCDEAAASNRQVRCLHRDGKLGLGTAVLAGLKRAVADR